MKATRIGAVMTCDVVTADRDTPFKEVVRRLEDHHVSGMPVIDQDRRVLGVVSETDLMLRQARPPRPDRARDGWSGRLHGLGHRVRRGPGGGRAGTAGQVMSAPAVTVRAGATVSQAARLMAGHRIERLPVVDEENRLLGIVTRRDLLRVFLRTDDEIRREVQREVLVNTLWLTPRIVDTTVEDGVVTLTGELERRSDIPVALGMTSRLDGVVDVVDHLTYRLDDSRLKPAEQALHGVADDWLRGL
ncbi:CBS domain-containing protein [Streptomyces sp. NPDC020801]|uniref:CBS domain-containing protein n=1 Tax=unclassified Streptomyces TaxID=2593676 RepID=UPI0037AF2CD6